MRHMRSKLMLIPRCFYKIQDYNGNDQNFIEDPKATENTINSSLVLLVIYGKEYQ
jgi:hypothetical protein